MRRQKFGRTETIVDLYQPLMDKSKEPGMSVTVFSVQRLQDGVAARGPSWSPP